MKVRCIALHDLILIPPGITPSPVFTKHRVGSTWPIQRSTSKPRSACLEIDQKIIAKDKLGQTNGLQDLPRSQLLT